MNTQNKKVNKEMKKTIAIKRIFDISLPVDKNS
jgi:hypothetical protein